MSAPRQESLLRIVRQLKGLRTDISIPTDFYRQMDRIDLLLMDDKSGIVNTIFDFMVNTSSVPMKIETKNEPLDKVLKIWQTVLLNKDINIDIPRGLRELSGQYFRERWRSSFIALNIDWEDVNVGGTKYTLPANMWFADGGAITVKEDVAGDLAKRKYFLGKGSDAKALKNSSNHSVIIRKPFSAWYDALPTPYLVRKGVLFNSLLKEAIVMKQADVLQAIIPYLLLLKSGSDKLAEMEMLSDEDSLKELKEKMVKAVQEHDVTGALSSLIATLSYDVSAEHFMPDLLKVMNKEITAGCNQNIFAGMGMIEIQGFASNREETIMNPKMLVEEIKDAVADWALMLEEVVFQIIEKNKIRKVTDLSSEVKVVPGLIKAFITDQMKTLFSTLQARGLISNQSATESIGEFDWDVEKERRKNEKANGDDELMYPHVVQSTEPKADNQTPNGDGDTPDNQNPKLKNTKENKKEKAEVIESLVNPFKTIDELPESVRKDLPIGAQLVYLKAYNATNKTEDSSKIAWGAVENTYAKNTDGKWMKK